MDNYKRELFQEYEDKNAEIEKLNEAIAELSKNEVAVRFLLFAVNDLVSQAYDAKKTLCNTFNLDTQKFAKELHDFRSQQM